jgi:hypothetical protein
VLRNGNASIRYSDICYQMTKDVNSSRHRFSLTFGPLCFCLCACTVVFNPDHRHYICILYNKPVICGFQVVLFLSHIFISNLCSCFGIQVFI